MSKRPTFPLYYKDFFMEAKYLNCEETGAYLQLLVHQWDDGYLPNNKEMLAALVKSTPEKLEEVLKKFTLCKDGKLRNENLEKIRAENDAFREKKSLAGSKGVNQREANRKQNSNKNENLDETNPNPSSREEVAVEVDSELEKEIKAIDVEKEEDVEIAQTFFSTKELTDVWEKFKKYREEKKRPFTKTSAETFMTKILNDCNHNEWEAAKRLTTAIASDWLNAYPEKKEIPKRISSIDIARDF